MTDRIPNTVIQGIRFRYLKILRLKCLRMEAFLHLQIAVERRFCLRDLWFVFLNSMSKIHQFPWNLSHKSGNAIILRFPTHHTLLRTGHSQFFHGSGDSHITKPALLFQLRLVTGKDAHTAREHAIFHSGKVYIWKFQSLCTVQSHQYHIILILIYRINIRDQRNFFQESG